MSPAAAGPVYRGCWRRVPGAEPAGGDSRAAQKAASSGAGRPGGRHKGQVPGVWPGGMGVTRQPPVWVQTLTLPSSPFAFWRLNSLAMKLVVLSSQVILRIK